MKLKLGGRLPLNIDKDLGFSLASIFREIETAFNDLESIVLDSANHSAVITADALVKTGKGKYKGYTVNVVTAVGTIDIRDGVAAGGGVIIEQIPAAKAVGRYETNRPWVFETGIYVDYGVGATGSLVILYE
jgi:hypothetical protein